MQKNFITERRKSKSVASPQKPKLIFKPVLARGVKRGSLPYSRFAEHPVDLFGQIQGVQKLPEHHQPRRSGDRVAGRFEFEGENRLPTKEVAPFVHPSGGSMVVLDTCHFTRNDKRFLVFSLAFSHSIAVLGKPSPHTPSPGMHPNNLRGKRIESAEGSCS